MTYREKYRGWYLRFLKEENEPLNINGYRHIPTSWWTDGILTFRWLQFFSYIGVEDIKHFFDTYNIELTKKDRHILRKGIKNGSMYKTLTCLKIKYGISGSDQDFHRAYITWLDSEMI